MRLQIIFAYFAFLFVYSSAKFPKNEMKQSIDQKLEKFRATLEDRTDMTETDKIIKLREMHNYLKVDAELKMESEIKKIKKNYSGNFFSSGKFVRYLAYSFLVVFVCVMLYIIFKDVTVNANAKKKEY